MKAVTVTKQQFDEHLFPAFVSKGAEDERQMEVAVRVLRKFKDPRVTEDEEIDPRVIESAKGKTVYPNRLLTVDRHTFALEEDEHRLVVERLKAFVTRINVLAAEDFLATLAAVKDAPPASEVAEQAE